MAIVGAHVLLYSSAPEALRATLRDVFGWKPVDAEVKGEPQDEGFGVTVMLNLPGNVEVMLYEPRHAVAVTPVR
jgi:hypothetical protein